MTVGGAQPEPLVTNLAGIGFRLVFAHREPDPVGQKPPDRRIDRHGRNDLIPLRDYAAYSGIQQFLLGVDELLRERAGDRRGLGCLVVLLRRFRRIRLPERLGPTRAAQYSRCRPGPARALRMPLTRRGARGETPRPADRSPTRRDPASSASAPPPTKRWIDIAATTISEPASNARGIGWGRE